MVLDDNDRAYLQLIDDFLGSKWMDFIHFMYSHKATGAEVVTSHNKIFGTKLPLTSFTLD